jgi:siroheme synthase
MMVVAHDDDGTYGECAATMVTLAKAGRRVVRLIGTSIARAEAETAACRAAGVTVAHVAGVAQAPANKDLSVVSARENGRSSNH